MGYSYGSVDGHIHQQEHRLPTCCGNISSWCRQLATLEKARDGRQIVLRQADDVAFAQALRRQVSEWVQVRLSPVPTHHCCCQQQSCDKCTMWAGL